MATQIVLTYNKHAGHIIKPNANYDRGAYTCGFIGWDRLADELKKSGEVKENERVSCFIIDDMQHTGIRYVVEPIGSNQEIMDLMRCDGS